jgi:hypothetical protein
MNPVLCYPLDLLDCVEVATNATYICGKVFRQFKLED